MMDKTDNESNASPTSANPTTTSEAQAASAVAVPFGDWLKEQRVSRKISLEEIAAVTKVHILQLRALEENESAKLPAPAFVRGFLVSYSRHLGIDENEVLERYKRNYGTLTPLADLLMPATNRSAKSQSAPKVSIVTSPSIRQAPSARETEKPWWTTFFNFRNTAIIFSILAVAVLIGSLIAIGKRSKDATAPIASTSKTIETKAPNKAPDTAAPSSSTTPTLAATAPVAAQTASASPQAPAPSAKAPAATKSPPPAAAVVAPPMATAPNAPTVPAKYQVEVHAIEQNFLNIRVDDGSPKGLFLKSGMNHPFEASRRVTFSFSDAGNVEIKWNGVWYQAVGSRGDVKTLTLPEQLPTLVAKAAAPKKIIKSRTKVIPPADGSLAPGAAAGEAPKQEIAPSVPVDSRE